MTEIPTPEEMDQLVKPIVDTKIEALANRLINFASKEFASKEVAQLSLYNDELFYAKAVVELFKAKGWNCSLKSNSEDNWLELSK